MNIVALAGGVGGAKLVDGLAQCMPHEELTVIVNTGDDFNHLGLWVCPDLDTVCYTLADLANPDTGWGRKEESWRVLDVLAKLNAPAWFRLGDLDVATHIIRTDQLNHGRSLTEITRNLCQSWGVDTNVLPMCNQPVPTMVQTLEYGEIHFQEYFVRYQCQPTVTGFRFHGIEEAVLPAEVSDALTGADAVIICPSNPWVSIGPILAIPGVRPILEQKKTLAVSPLIGGRAVKGPAAKMYRELGITPSSSAVAAQYHSLLNGFVLDVSDAHEVNQIKQWGIISFVTNILMSSKSDRKRLAQETLAFCEQL